MKIEARSLPQAYRPSSGTPFASSTRPSPSPRRPALPARSAGHTATAKKRPGPNLAHAGIGLVVRIAVDAVEVAGPPAELLVNAGFRIPVVVGDGPLELGWIGTDPLRQTAQRVGLDQVSGLDEWIELPGTGVHQANAVVADKAAVADQMGGHARHGLVRPQHGHAEVVVRIGLVHEPAPGAVDGDQARLGAIKDDMRNTDVVPFLRGMTELGIHRPGLSSLSSRAAPARTAVAMPSPVFVSGASE